MPKTIVYQISVPEDSQLEQQVNFILNQISDRLDKLEGIRGTSTIQDGITIENDGEILHGVNTDDEV